MTKIKRKPKCDRTPWALIILVIVAVIALLCGTFGWDYYQKELSAKNQPVTDLPTPQPTK